MALQVQRLEPRQLMASDWQNSVVPYDVDESGMVSAFDALLVINELNQKGFRHLGSRPAGSTEFLCDVNGDQALSVLDAHLLVDALNLYTSNSLAIDAKLDANSDPNGNEVVLQPQVIYRGTTMPYTHVKVEAVDPANRTQSQTVVSNEEGKFELQLNLQQAINHLKFTANDPRLRTKTTERIVRYGDVIAEWNAEMLEAVRETTAPSSIVPGLLIKPPPPLVAKQLAMMHTAMFDAINAINPRFESYALDVAPQTGASEVVAAATAAHRVASKLYDLPFHITKWDLTLTESLKNIPNSLEKQRGIEVGTQAANAILAMRANDGSSLTSSYQSQNAPGRWQPTSPDFAPPTLPQWPQVTPFVMDSDSTFRPAPPPALNSPEYAAAVDEVMSLGSSTNSTRTVDQGAIAKFWADGGGTVTPPGHWNSIAIDMVLTRPQSLVDKAHTMALLNLALADAGIAAWDAKYAYDLWRPIDAIREAETDGNVGTDADLNWKPLLNTPSFPSYVSGHSTFSSAAATVLSEIYGEQVAFSTQIDK